MAVGASRHWFLENRDITLLAFAPLCVFLLWLVPWYLELLSCVAVASLLIKYGNQEHPIPPKKYEATYDFKNTNVDSTLKFNVIQGISFAQWTEVLWLRWRYIDWRTYWHRVGAITGMSILNSVLGLIDWAVWGKQVAETELNQRPVFVLGHPRTGTTLLHNLIAKDSDQFTYTTTFQCGFPNGFLCLNNSTHHFAHAMEDTRPQDNMELSFTVPQEDELAVSSATSLSSPYAPLNFMTCEPDFRKYFTYKDSTPQERSRYIEALLYFLRKVTFCNDGDGPKRRMVIKSPVHTARVELLYQLFPEAQFVYIHRDPYRVFMSAANMAQTTYTYNYLAEPSKERIQDFILNQYDVLFDGYLEAKRILPESSFFVTTFDKLTKDMPGVMQDIYSHFNWAGWDKMEPVYKEYAASQKTYKKNDLRPIDPKLKEVIYNACKRSFEEFGYAK